jgi:predicted ATP-dependent protease
MQQDATPSADGNRWHVGREVPLTLLAGMLAQVLIAAMFISDLKNEIKVTAQRVEEIWRDRYTRVDAAKDSEVARARDEAMALRLEDHERRLRAIEAAANGRRPQST